MSRITRDSFVGEAGGESLDVNTLSGEAKQAIKNAGLSEAELKSIAGGDGIISGEEELGKLFDYIDKTDHNHSYKSIDTTQVVKDGREVATQSGALYEALEHELEKARFGGPSSAETEPKTPPQNESPPHPAAKPAEHNPSGAAHAAHGNDKPPRTSREPPSRLANAVAPATTADRDLALTTLKNRGFTDIHLASNTPYFSQADSRWGSHSYPKTPPEKDQDGNLINRTYQNAGCAPSAVAMADVALRGSKATPLDVGQYAVDHKFSGRPGSNGSDAHGLGKAWAKEHDLKYTDAQEKSASKNVDIVRDGLKTGGVAVIGVGLDPATKQGHFTEKGHIMVVNGYAKDRAGKEWFFVVNPGRNDQTQGKVLKTDAHVVQDRSLHHGAGQLMISREQLEKEMKHAFVLHNADQIG